MKRIAGPIASAAASLLVLGACTGGSGSAPTSSGVGPTAPDATLTGTAPTAQTTTGAASCSSSSTTLTFRRHSAITAGGQFGLPPGGRKTTPADLPVVTVVHARAPGLGRGSGLTAAVGRHWHVPAAALGTSTRRLGEGTVTLHDHTRHNEAYVVFNSVRVFTGEYSALCGPSRVMGRYTTFGPIGTTVADCHGGHPGALEKLARRQFC